MGEKFNRNILASKKIYSEECLSCTPFFERLRDSADGKKGLNDDKRVQVDQQDCQYAKNDRKSVSKYCNKVNISLLDYYHTSLK